MNAKAIQRVLDDKRAKEKRMRLARVEAETHAYQPPKAPEIDLTKAAADAKAIGTVKARAEYAKLKRKAGG
ncbi:hypothetical protein [Sporosarcina aquimarina]|uniref:YfhD family protein n=1 Tax=Sporosarcina aquimarina TaxID=114975 RepID=A0ABU4G2B3_9BACL|nr:hypothetical protein [Sporosarcina aquimarina]MDW0110453.1 hypothetical protein [Sporosarcina aquimarina]